MLTLVDYSFPMNATWPQTLFKVRALCEAYPFTSENDTVNVKYLVTVKTDENEKQNPVTRVKRY